MLAGHRRMRDLVRVYDPGRAGRKAEFNLRDTLLIRVVRFHRVVDVQHRVAVRGAIGFRRADAFHRPRPSGPTRGGGFEERARDLFEGPTEPPMAAFAI